MVRAENLLYGSSGRHSRLPSGRLIMQLKLKLPEARSVAELENKQNTPLTADFHFQSIAVETLSPINGSACEFLSLLTKKITQ